jgi:hypothetical protein
MQLPALYQVSGDSVYTSAAEHGGRDPAYDALSGRRIWSVPVKKAAAVRTLTVVSHPRARVPRRHGREQPADSRRGGAERRLHHLVAMRQSVGPAATVRERHGNRRRYAQRPNDMERAAAPSNSVRCRSGSRPLRRRVRRHDARQPQSRAPLPVTAKRRPGRKQARCLADMRQFTAGRPRYLAASADRSRGARGHLP